ncbi:MAG: type transport system ATP-binding protein, partial [Solirubrobacteraceae bacterium]|nr:type transport system ATP-binding protein [Solirubrobacteraceae bacterium]
TDTAGRYELRTTDDARAAEIAAARPGIADVAPADRGLTLAGAEAEIAALSIALGEAGVGIGALIPRTATLEELFFRMTEGEDAAPGADAPAAASPNGRAPVEEPVA